MKSLSAAAFLILWPWVVCGLPMATGQQTPAPAVTDPPALPLAAELEAQKKAVSENTDLAEPLRMQIGELYSRAVQRLEELNTADRTRRQLMAESEQAASAMQELQAKLDGYVPTEINIVDLQNSTSEEISQKLTEFNAEIVSRRAALDAVAAEISRRSERRGQLPALRSQAQEQLADVDRELAIQPPADEPPELTAARRQLLHLRHHALQAQLAFMDQEARTYDANTRLWSLRRDLAERQLRDSERAVNQVQSLLSQSRQREAQAASQEARRAAANAHPAVRDVAKRNSELADASRRVLSQLETTRRQINESTELRDSRAAEFDSLKRRAEAAGFSQAIGVLLRNQRGRLPDPEPIRLLGRDRAVLISDTNLRLIEWEAERNQVPDPEEAVQGLVDRLPSDDSEAEREEIAGQLKAALTQQRRLLSTLTDDGARLLDRLVALDSLDRDLVKLVEDQSDYIAEHVLWVRSAEPIRAGTVRNAWVSAATVFSPTSWRIAGTELWEDVSGRPVAWSAFVTLLLYLLSRRGRLRSAIRSDGRLAAASTCTSIAPTLRAVVNSLLLAVLGPAILWFAGWRIGYPPAGPSVIAIGRTLQSAALLWFPVELIRQLIRQGGLCELHFGWSARSLSVVRRWLGLTMVMLVPCSLVVLLCESLDDEMLHAGLERLFFVAGMVVLSFGLLPVLRRRGVVLQDIASSSPQSLLARTRLFWPAVIILSPALLAALSVAGYHFSAMQMFRRLVVTSVLIMAVVVTYLLFNRWLLITYRRLAIERNRLRREAQLHAAAQAAEDPAHAAASVADDRPEISLTQVNQQTQRMMKLGAALCSLLGLWMIWSDVLPALGILRGVQLWENQIAASVDGEAAPWVTLADLVLAITAGVLTFVATRNIPGLLEITVLARLPMDAGARYAASAVTRYLIAVVGTTVSFWLIGIGWSSVQWLIAAMTVGLGFGLQEIFANFVSGLILLFERPIRVGDTVTVNNINGTVARIRIRATTIVDWDNRELIVPNKAFVTDNLINWTLTNPDVRMILRVGIAYGSDTRKATEILYKVVHEHPEVLDDPEPVVVFKEFGDSSLNFEARLFVTGLVAYRRLQHDLNMAIDDEFRQAGIEIAFPQRDLHLRSLPPDGFRPAADTVVPAPAAADQAD